MGIPSPDFQVPTRIHGAAHWFEWCIAPEEETRVHRNQYHLIVTYEDVEAETFALAHVVVNPGVLADFFPDPQEKWAQLCDVASSKTPDEMVVLLEQYGLGNLFAWAYKSRQEV